MPPSIYRALRITQDRDASHGLRAQAGRILAAHVERTGAPIGFGDAQTWRDYAAAQEGLAADAMAIGGRRAA